MSASTIARQLSADPAQQERITRDLDRHGLSERELDAVLLLTEHSLEVSGVAPTDSVTVVRACEAAIDTIFARRKNSRPGEDGATPGDAAIPGKATLQETPRWTRLDFERIERDGIPDVDWIFPGWIITGDIFCLAGDASVGKSTLLSRLAYASASKGEWVGIQATRKLRVLYIDEEESDLEVYHLFTKHGPRLPDSDLRVFVQQGANLDSDDGLAIIEREVADFAPDLILIDSATAAFGRTEGNSNTEVAAVYRRLFHLRKTYHLTIGFNHHLGKPGEMKRSLMHRVLGSVAFGTQASAVFGAISHDADSLELVQGKRRLAPKPYPSIVVGYKEEGGRCCLENRGAVEDKTSAIVSCSEWLTSYLGELGAPAKCASLVDAAKGLTVPYNEDTVTKALAHGVKLGVLEKPRRGWYTTTARTGEVLRA